MAQYQDLQSSMIGITENDPVVYELGQRRCGPPFTWTGDSPAKGCEVFVAKIPKNCFEKDLVPILRQVGEIYTFRLMMENEDSHRGFGFCIYTCGESAKNAVGKLNNYQIRKGCFLGICFSVDNCRLFVGGIPKLKVKEDIFREMSKVTENVVDIIMYPSAADKNKNRGFAFVEYTDHKSAAVARKQMIGDRIQLWGHNVAVDWAEPERKVDDETMSKVKILYVRNLMLTTTEDIIFQAFSKFTTEEDEIVRVKKIGDFAFVHFKNRDKAEIVKENMNGSDLEGSIIEVHFAKPANKLEQQQKLFKRSSTSFNKVLPLTLPNELGKLTIESNGSKLICPIGFESSGNTKSYRNAAGRCSIKSKQIIKNNVPNGDSYFSNFAEMLTFICQTQGLDGPFFSVQIIPMFLSNKEATIQQLFLAQAFIPSLNCNFPSRIAAFTQEEAIINASETALQWMYYNGIQIPNLWEDTVISSTQIQDNEENFTMDNELQWAHLNYGMAKDLSLTGTKAMNNQQPYMQPFIQYNPLVPYYTNQSMQPNNYDPFYQDSGNRNGELDRIPVTYKKDALR